MAIFALAATSAPAADDYPSKPGRLILPSGAGASADIMGRIFSQRFSEAWGQPLVVDNRAGAAGIIATELAARAAPDGYTLFMNSSQGFTDVAGGQMQACFFTLPGLLPFVKAGRMRALAVSSARRAEQLPQVPTVMETGVAEFDVTVWQGFAVPRGTAQHHVTKIHVAMMKAAAMPELKQRFFENGVAVVPMTPGEFTQFVNGETAKWQKAVTVSGIQKE